MLTRFRTLHFYDKNETGMTNKSKNDDFGDIFENHKTLGESLLTHNIKVIE